jgi:hypothetical protein
VIIKNYKKKAVAGCRRSNDGGSSDITDFIITMEL